MILEDDTVFLHDSATTLYTIVGETSRTDWNVILLDCGGIDECGPITDDKKIEVVMVMGTNPVVRELLVI